MQSYADQHELPAPRFNYWVNRLEREAQMAQLVPVRMQPRHGDRIVLRFISSSVATQSSIQGILGFTVSVEQRDNDQASVPGSFAQLAGALDRFQRIHNRFICSRFVPRRHLDFLWASDRLGAGRRAPDFSSLLDLVTSRRRFDANEFCFDRHSMRSTKVIDILGATSCGAPYSLHKRVTPACQAVLLAP
jgi:hypothetical protein